MPISYSEPSSDEEYIEDYSWMLEDAKFGIPEKCICGRLIELQGMSAEAVRTPGRQYYSCPAWLEEYGTGEHIFKFWDEAVTEQLGILERRISNQKRDMGSVERVPDTSMALLKEEVRVIQGEVARLKEALANQGDSYMLLGFLCVVAEITYMFK
ncbi:uncharacterized protein LOC112087849 [Eutrema salsugineum]|uniref:uncharacterized protein LOC112087849 n=1 Tax=Eutrema salsugineum TaxID=72664 RepID=UPI000CED537E|nr:uncharacterized protein LOC112087849 [Eutrema salsugineum]